MRFFGKTTLIKKLLAFYLVIVVGSFYFIMFFGKNFIYSQVREETKNAMINSGKQIVSSFFGYSSYTSDSIKKLRNELSMAGETSGSRILVIQDNGDMILDTGEKYTPKVYNVKKHHESDFLQNEYTYDYTIGGYLSTPCLCVSLPLYKSSSFSGYLIIVQSNEYINEKTDFYFGVLLLVYYALLGLLLLTYIAIYFF